MSEKGYKIVANAEVLRAKVTLDQFIAMQEGDLKTIKSVLSQFVVNSKGNPIPAKTGAAWIGSLTLDQIDQAGSDFVDAVGEAAVPKEKG